MTIAIPSQERNNYFYSNYSVVVKMKNTAPSALQPKVAVTAIQSVEWLTRPDSGTRNPGTSTAADLAKLESHNGGYRTFPEQTTPSSPVYDKVEARVTLAAPIPVGMTGRVTFKVFDPKNALAEENPTVFLPDPDDNYGTMVVSSGGNTTIITPVSAGISQFSKGFAITSAHAGDNYIVAAHPNPVGLSGYRFYTVTDAYATGCGNIPFDKVATALMYLNPNTKTTAPGNPPVGYSFLGASHQTSVLTVWRTLWAELDQIALPPNNIFKAELPFIDGFVKSELARACIDIKPYTPNPTAWVSGLEVMPYAWNNGTSGIANACRNSPTPTETFWTVHMIGAFRGEPRPKAPTDPNPTIPNLPPLGRHYGGNNTIFVFNWQIENAVDVWNQNNPNQQIPSNRLGDIKRRTSLHEIGHIFDLKDNVYGSGIMEYKNMYERLLPANKEFRPEELRDIQAQSKPK